MAAFLGLGGCALQVAGQEYPDGIEYAVQQDLARVAATGAVLGVVTREGILWMESFGRTGLDDAAAMHPRELMHLGTFGDFLLAGLALEMEAAGFVPLNTPVRRFLPRLPPGLGARTLEALLLHTGGFDASPLDYRPVGTSARRGVIERERQMLNDQVVMLPANVIRSDSPHHTLLAGMVLEAVAGGPLEGALRSYLLRPAGVTEVEVAPAGGMPSGVRPGFQVRLAPGEPYGLAPFPEPAVLQPQHRLWAHAHDVSRILRYLMFDGQGRAALRSPQVPDPFDAPGAGAFSLGFRWDALGRGRTIGDAPGYTTEVRFISSGDPEADDGIVVFAMANGGASRLDRALARIEDWIRAREPHLLAREADPGLAGPTPVTAAGLGPTLAGRYRNGSEALRLVWEDGAMEVDLGLGSRLPIRDGTSGELEAYLPDGRVALTFRMATFGPTALLLTRGIAFAQDACPAPQRH